MQKTKQTKKPIVNLAARPLECSKIVKITVSLRTLLPRTLLAEMLPLLVLLNTKQQFGPT